MQYFRSSDFVSYKISSQKWNIDGPLQRDNGLKSNACLEWRMFYILWQNLKLDDRNVVDF